MATVFDMLGLAKGLEKVQRQTLPAIHRGIATGFATWAHGEAVSRYPVGTTGKTSPHPGKARASNVASAGDPQYAELPDRPAYPIPGESEAGAGLAGIRYADNVWLSNDAKSGGGEFVYPNVLEAGRGLNSAGVMSGSEQAPDGIYKPIHQEAPAELDRIVRGVLAQVAEVRA